MAPGADRQKHERATKVAHRAIYSRIQLSNNGTLSAPAPFECANMPIYSDVDLAHARRSEVKVHAQQVGLYVKLRTTNTATTWLCEHLLGSADAILCIGNRVLGCFLNEGSLL